MDSTADFAPACPFTTPELRTLRLRNCPSGVQARQSVNVPPTSSQNCQRSVSSSMFQVSSCQRPRSTWNVKRGSSMRSRLANSGEPNNDQDNGGDADHQQRDGDRRLKLVGVELQIDGARQHLGSHSCRAGEYVNGAELAERPGPGER